MPIKILVFESDATFAEDLKSSFAALGCETTVVDDANIGLQVAARERPDLILLSIELPRMNGFSVCNKLKRDAALKDVPLIIMSSDSTEETFEQHRRLRTRAEDYLHKPIGFDELLAHIQPFVAIGAAADEPEYSESDLGDELGNDGAVVLDEDIEIEDAEVVEDTQTEIPIHGPGVDQDVNDFADQAFGALEVGGDGAPLVHEGSQHAAQLTEPEIAEPEITEPEIAEPEITEAEIAEAEIAEAEIAEAEIAEAEIAPAPDLHEVDVAEAEIEPAVPSLPDLRPLSGPAPRQHFAPANAGAPALGAPHSDAAHGRGRRHEQVPRRDRPSALTNQRAGRRRARRRREER